MGRTPQKAAENSQKIEIMGSTVDRIVSRRTFEPYDRPIVGCRFVRLRRRGDSIIGHLGWPIPNFQQGTSYPIKLENGEIVEIVANKFLHRQISKGQLCGRRVEIIYQGRLFLTGGHYRKIYRIYEIKNVPIFSKEQWNRIIQKTKQGSEQNG